MTNTTQLLIASAIAPVGFLMAWTWFRDRLPEPPRVVLATFLLGAIASVPILMVEFGVSKALGLGDAPETIRDALLTSFVVAALVEEYFKYLVLWRYSATHSAFDEPYDGIVYGVAASLGFACVENVGYVLAAQEELQAGFATALGRALFSIPLHTACGAIMGTFIGVARFKRGSERSGWVILGLAAAILVHGIYDSVVFATPLLADSEDSPAFAIGALATIAVTLGAWVAAACGAAWLRKRQVRRAS